MTRLITAAALAAAAFTTVPALAAPITFGQTESDANTGTGDFGQAFVLTAEDGYTAPSYTLDAATFFRGSDAGGDDTLFLDVYKNSGADETAAFGTSGAPSGVTYVGSSTNFVNHDTAVQGAALDFAFSEITLDRGTKYYLVFSTDRAEGSLVGTSTRQAQLDSADAFTYVNISPTNTAPLLGGNEGGDIGTPSLGANEHQFTATVTAVPEPTSGIALLAGLATMTLRRRR